MLKWVIVVIIPIVLLIGAVAWFLTIGKDSEMPWQAAQVEGQQAGVPGEKSATLSPDQRPQPKGSGPGWAVNCKSGARDQALNCRLSQTVVMKGSNRLLTRATFVLPTPEQESQINIQLPLGVQVPAGTTISIDDSAPQSLQFRTCDRNGCYAATTLSSAFLAQLRKGGKLNIAFKNLADKTIRLSMSLDGFEQAYVKAQDA